MNFRKYIKNKKLITKIVSLILLSLTIFSVFSYQNHKINDLEYNLQTKQQIEEMSLGRTSTQMDTQKIKVKFNELMSYQVFSGKISFTHSYEYSRDSILGFKSRCTLKGTADTYFSYNVDLANADIEENDYKIVITLDKPYLDKDTLHVAKDSIHIIENESGSNIFANKNDSRKTMQYFIDSLEDKAYEDIKDYYDNHEMDFLEKSARYQIRDLAKRFTSKKVKVRIK